VWVAFLTERGHKGLAHEPKASILASEMGLDTNLKKLAKTSWAPHAFKESKTMPQPLKDSVIIEDLLHRVTTQAFCSYPPTFTGDAIYDFVLGPVKQHLANDQWQVRGYVLTLDDEKAKADLGRKAKTLAKRASTRPSVQPYDTGMELCADGLMASDSKVGCAFQLGRLMATRSLRTKLWAYVESRIAHDTDLLAQLAVRKQVLVFEHLASGPRFFPNRDSLPIDMVKTTGDFQHGHVEGDPSSVWWAKTFRGHPSIVVSRDTDIMLSFLLLDEDEQPAKCRWWTMKDAEVIDLPALVKGCCKAVDLTRHQLALVCILAGTDFVDKGEYAKGFGCTSILHTMREFASSGQVGAEGDALVDHFPFDAFLRRMYAQVHKVGRKHMIDLVNNFTCKTVAELEEDESEPGRQETPSKRQRADSKGTAVATSSSSSSSTRLSSSLVSASWSEIQKDYAGIKAHTLPSTEQLNAALDAIRWNFRFAKV
jgi:hypothetical protein